MDKLAELFITVFIGLLIRGIWAFAGIFFYANMISFGIAATFFGVFLEHMCVRANKESEPASNEYGGGL